MDAYHEMIKEICNELNIEFNIIADDWVMVLKSGYKLNVITGYKFPLNSHSVGMLFDDKGLLYEFCKLEDINIIEHKVFFENYKKEDAIKYFNDHKKEVILKGNLGTCGREVFKINDENTLIETMNKLMKSQYSVSLCPYYHIDHEYRVFVLDNKIKLIYGKTRPIVFGDGKKTLLELAEEFNPLFYNDKKNQKFKKDYIPKKNEKICLDFRFNLANGAVPFIDINSNILSKLYDFTENLIDKIDIGFASVDIIDVDGTLYLMEINSGVMINKLVDFNLVDRETIKNIYKEAIKMMF